jgi:tRNA pseudouridine55 synthase
VLGILLIDKPYGITSHDVVNDVRRRFGTRRVGHAGTLDPLATGVLVVAVGPATRFLQYLPLEPKEYVATITFGQSSDTYDIEGKLSDPREVPADLRGSLQRVSPEFRGLIQQIPPLHSAIKVNGKAMYKYARSGQEVHREPRTVHIGSLDFEAFESNNVVCRVICSGGTYIRSLANDLGERLGCGAYLSALAREKVGRFERSDCVPLAEIATEQLLPLREALAPMPMIPLDKSKVREVREGRQVQIETSLEESLVGLLDSNGSVFSVARLTDDVLQPECVIPEEAILDPS